MFSCHGKHKTKLSQKTTTTTKPGKKKRETGNEHIRHIRKYYFFKQNPHKPLKLRKTYKSATETDGKIRAAFFSRFLFLIFSVLLSF